MNTNETEKEIANKALADANGLLDDMVKWANKGVTEDQLRKVLVANLIEAGSLNILTDVNFVKLVLVVCAAACRLAQKENAEKVLVE